MTTENPEMWTYWRDKYGIEAALTDYYPNTLAEDQHLRTALSHLIMAKSYIDMRMAELATKWSEEDD